MKAFYHAGIARASANAAPGPLWPPISRQEDGLVLLRNLPRLDRAVVARRGEQLSVGAERHGPHRAGVFLECRPYLARLDAPQPDWRVLTSRGKRLAVRAESHASGNTVMGH